MSSSSPPSLASSHYIAGDIGGTNSRLQLFRVNGADGAAAPSSSVAFDADALKSPGGSVVGSDELVFEKQYPSQKYASLTFVIQKFLSEAAADQKADEGAPIRPVAMCLAVAGPVRANKATITNVNWTLDGAEMSEALGIRDVLIINDFVGIGYGLLALERKDLFPLNDVPIAADAPKVCIGAGTGLGEVYLTAGHKISSDYDPDAQDAEYNVWASEGGHADFAPRDKLEFGLLEWFKTQERVTRVSVERIVSGLGIPKIYNYLSSLHPEEVLPEVTARLRTEDPGKVIGEFADAGACTLCQQSIELFVRCYGAEAGNLALKMLPFGGLYISGGIAAKVKKFMLKDNLFWQSFVQKGRMQGLLERVPVFIVEHPAVGLLGAKVVCRRLLRQEGFRPGRGELASFSNATPKSLAETFGEVFAYPDSLGEGHDFETEVKLEAATQKPESVVIRRRKDTHAHSPVHRSAPKGFSGPSSDAFKYGLLGGAITSVATVALLCAGVFLSSRIKRTQ